MKYSKQEQKLYELIVERLLNLPTDSEYHGQDKYEVSNAAHDILMLIRKSHENNE